MTDVQAAKLRAHAERTMDVIWPEWRTEPVSRDIHEAVKGAVQYGFDAAGRGSSTANEEEVQRRIRVVTEKHAADLERLNRETAGVVNRTLTDLLTAVRLFGDEAATKHGSLSLPVLLIRAVELMIHRHPYGAVVR